MKIIGSDYDGTFTCGGVSEEKLQAVKSWQAAGHKFGIVSGRGGSFLTELQEKYPALSLDFFASCNGGYVLDVDGNEIYGVKCREVALSTLVPHLFELGCGWVYLHSDVSVTVKADNPDWQKEIPEWDYFYQAAVWLPDEEMVDRLAKVIEETYAPFLTPLTNGRSLDIVPKGVNKAEGLRRVAEHFGCTEEDVIAVGDNTNDIDMIAAFRSYAMASGKAEVIALADETVVDIAEIFEKENLS